MTEFARKICKRLHAYLRMDHYSGRISSISAAVLRIDTGIGVLSVLSNTNCLHPFSLTVNQTKPFTDIDLFEGQDVEIIDQRIYFSDSDLLIDCTQATDIELCIDVMKSLFLPLDLNIRVRHLTRVIENGSSTHSLAALATDGHRDLVCESVFERLPKLYGAVYEQIPEDCRNAGASLAGYGNGITPDSDDLIEGFLAGYSALSMALGRNTDRVRLLTREIAAGASEHTTEVSGAFLLQAGEGLVNEDVFHLLQSVFSDVPYRMITTDATRVAKGVIPAGVNLLTGIYLAVISQYIPARTI